MTSPLSRARTNPLPARRRRAAAAMRAIGQRRHTRTGTRAYFVCEPCHVAWNGAEADCWNCGSPASAEHGRHGAALQRLLTAVLPRPIALVKEAL